MTASDRPVFSGPPSSVNTEIAPPPFDPEPLLFAFEQAWQAGGPPSIETLLAGLPAGGAAAQSARRRLLEEMVKIDLEYRWRNTALAGDDLPSRLVLEDYLKRFPILGTVDDLPVELIGEEYRVRRMWGDRPEAQAYFARFPRPVELPALLARIDAELAEHALCTTIKMMATPCEAPLSPQALPDGYEILGELGRGGMGVVYKARQLRLNRLVAIKMIRPGVETGATELSRFRTEAEAAARVQHPHVVQVYEVGEQDGHPYCVMEYVNGGSLAQRLGGSPMVPATAGRLLETLARAVQAIHDQGILHRDLKPSNVLLQVASPAESVTLTPDLLQSPTCVPKISDFGLAKPAESVGLTQSGAVLGTPSYMAPEQAESQSGTLGPSADVYGLGAIFYELLTGRPPFRGVTVLETLEQVRRLDPLRPRQLQPAVPRDLETICLKCLQKVPAKRYASAADLADDLERYRQSQPIQARPAGRWERGLKWARRRPALATLASAIILGLIAALSGGLTYTLQLRAARAETERQRQQASRSYRKALDAVEQMLVRMGAQKIEAIPGTEKAQVSALTEAIRMYQELLEEQDEPDPELYVRLSFALSYLGNRQMGLGKPDEAEDNCRLSLMMLKELPPELRDTLSFYHQSAFARYILGNILADRDRRDEAKRLYREACDILTRLGEDLRSRYLLVRCNTALGNFADQPDQSRTYHRRALELCEILHKGDPDNEDIRDLLTQSLFNLGRGELFGGRAEEAEKLFHRCVSLLEPFTESSPAAGELSSAVVSARNTLFHCYSGLAILWTNRGVADKAEAFHFKGIKIGEDLVRLYPHPPARAELSQSYVTMGASYHARQERKLAVEMYRKGIAIQEALVRELPGIAGYRLTLATSYGNLSLALDNVDEAFAVLQKGRDLLEPRMRSHPEDTTYAANFGILCNDQALVFYHHGQSSQAMPWHDRAVEATDAAYRRNPRSPECVFSYSMALGARATTLMGLHEYQKALADWDRLLEAVGPAEADKYRFLRALTLIHLGNHRQATVEIGKTLHGPDIDNDTRYNCACILSLAMAAVQKDPHLSREQGKQEEDQYAVRALEVLTKLRRDGYFRDPSTWSHFLADSDLEALRAHENFKRWSQKSSVEGKKSQPQ